MADWRSIPRAPDSAKDRLVLGWTDWTTLTVTGASWSAASGNPPQYCIDTMGFVHLRGAVTTATAPNPNTVLTLPTGVRPAVDSRWLLSSSGLALIHLSIPVNGQVSMLVATATTVDLSPVTFFRG